jgi:hypothetical protein
MRITLPELLMLAAAAILVVAALTRCSGGSGGGAFPASWALTPGVLNPDVTQASIRATICRSGFSRSIRPPTSYTNALKLAQMRTYARRGPPSVYQEDHLISLELGGNPTDPRNLWPEPYPRAAAVDRIENDLHQRVCSGGLTLAAAQRQESELKHRDG